MVFKFRLALALGRTVEELESTMSQREFVLWMIFSKNEPVGSIRDDYRTALQTMQIAGFFAAKNTKLKIEQFQLPIKHTPTSKTRTAEELNELNARALFQMTSLGPPTLAKPKEK